jgi:hypothetical protein
LPILRVFVPIYMAMNVLSLLHVLVLVLMIVLILIIKRGFFASCP